MASLSAVQKYFLGLSAIAVTLLWGVSLKNGTVSALFKAVISGQFEDGTSFNTRYTGFMPIDFPIALLVAFFFYGTNGSDRGYQLFLIDAYATLQSAFVWLYVESYRARHRNGGLKRPIWWALLWQAVGAAISLPLYFSHHLDWMENATSSSLPIPLPAARALPISFLLGAILPAVVGMRPAWIKRDPLRHQSILAAWQPDPIWVALIQIFCVFAFSTNQRYGRVEEDRRKAVDWTRRAYLLSAATSALGHAYVFANLAVCNNPDVSFSRMYIPSPPGPAPEKQILLNGPWLFLQYDLIIIGLSSVSWAYLLLDKIGNKQIESRIRRAALMTVSSCLLGFGATVSLVLWWRESKLEHAWKAEQASRHISVSLSESGTASVQVSKVAISVAEELGEKSGIDSAVPALANVSLKDVIVSKPLPAIKTTETTLKVSRYPADTQTVVPAPQLPPSVATVGENAKSKEIGLTSPPATSKSATSPNMEAAYAPSSNINSGLWHGTSRSSTRSFQKEVSAPSSNSPSLKTVLTVAPKTATTSINTPNHVSSVSKAEQLVVKHTAPINIPAASDKATRAARLRRFAAQIEETSSGAFDSPSASIAAASDTLAAAIPDPNALVNNKTSGSFGDSSSSGINGHGGFGKIRRFAMLKDDTVLVTNGGASLMNSTPAGLRRDGPRLLTKYPSLSNLNGNSGKQRRFQL